MSISWTTRPISVYPVPETPVRQRKSSPFRTGHSAAMQLLTRELRHLGARSAIMEIDIQPWDLRLDGGLRANARPQGPRVVVSAETRHGPMQWPRDLFRDHVSNIYAIALTLEKLRAIDRYGGTGRGEQYTGWLAIPASTGGSVGPVDAAWNLVAMNVPGKSPRPVSPPFRTKETALRYFREAAKIHHPDAGGHPDMFAVITRARDTILASLGEGAA